MSHVEYYPVFFAERRNALAIDKAMDATVHSVLRILAGVGVNASGDPSGVGLIERRLEMTPDIGAKLFVK